jgi:hypothetical protein
MALNYWRDIMRKSKIKRHNRTKIFRIPHTYNSEKVWLIKIQGTNYIWNQAVKGKIINRGFVKTSKKEIIDQIGEKQFTLIRSEKNIKVQLNRIILNLESLKQTLNAHYKETDTKNINSAIKLLENFKIED